MGDHDSTITMEGREVFKVAVRAVTDSVLTALDRAGVSPDEVDVLLPHQANIRIIEAICKRSGIDFAKSHNVIDYTRQHLRGHYPAHDGQGPRRWCAQAWRARGDDRVRGGNELGVHGGPLVRDGR